MSEATENTKPDPTSADYLLVIINGLDKGSRSRPNKVLSLLSSATVRVSLPHLGSAQNEFVEFVEESGGEVFGPVDAEKAGFGGSPRIAEARKVMTEQLGQFYGGMLQNDVLTIQVSPSSQKSEPSGLSLTDSTRHQWKKAHLYFPHQIGSCHGGATSGTASGSEPLPGEGRKNPNFA